MSIMSPKSSETTKFIVLSILIMMFVKIFMIDGAGSYFQSDSLQAPNQTIKTEYMSLKNSVPTTPPQEKGETPPPKFDFSDYLGQPQPNENIFSKPDIVELQKTPENQIKLPPPPSEIYPPVWDGKSKGKVILIIDDMGMAKKHTQDVIDLPAPMTLAFLPYATGLDAFTKDAKARGHELIIHVPMEPMDSNLDLGPAGLTTNLHREEFLKRLHENIFTSFDGYVGINNHMGSRLTQNERAMQWLMPELKKRGLFFVDSKTISTSIATKMAHAYGVDYAERDVFLDHKEDLQSVMKALYQTEQRAREKGYAIAIGHPKKNTIEGIKRWMVGMEDRGLELAPVSDVLTHFEKPSDAKIIWNDIPAAPPVTANIDSPNVDKENLSKRLLELENTEPAAGSPLDFIYLGEDPDLGSIRNQY